MDPKDPRPPPIFRRVEALEVTKGLSVLLVIAVIALGMVLGLGFTGPVVIASGSAAANPVTVIASTPTDRFVGAVSGGPYLFVGLLNGTVLRMDPLTGHISGSAVLPDRNSAAHLTFYNGSLYVGTEWLHGARNTGPFHVYKVDPASMKILGQVPMTSRYANGFLMAFNGFLWAGDGRCTLSKIDPKGMLVLGTVPHVAEDEMLFDGTYYWAECRNTVNVLEPGSGMPTLVASGSLAFPDRPRGFFMLGATVYSSGTLDHTIYAMSLSGNSVVFKNAVVVGDQSLPTRDTMLYRGLLYAYRTGPGADAGKIPASVAVYGQDLRLRGVVPLPGSALGSDASQHTLFAFNGRLYFVTASSVGLFDPALVHLTSTTTSASQTSTSVSHATTTIRTAGTPSIDRTFLVLLMVIVGVVFTVIYLSRTRAAGTWRELRIRGARRASC